MEPYQSRKILFKEWLKNYNWIYRLNAYVKCCLLKLRRYYLVKQYNRKSKFLESPYDSSKVPAAFKEKHGKLQPSFSPKRLGTLKIFWIGASKAQDESGFIQGLRKIGPVTHFVNADGQYGPIYEKQGLNWKEVRQLNDEILLEQIRNVHHDMPIDLVIGQMWSHVFSASTMQEIQELGIPIINIAMDDRLPELWGYKNGVRMGSVGLGNAVALTLTTSAEACCWYHIENMPALFWTLASDPTLFKTEKKHPKNIEILFIGNRYGIRKKLIEFLWSKGVRVSCYGSGWPNGYVNAQQNSHLSKRAKIILGIGTIGHCSDIYTLKLRDFDAIMTGALYITHRNPDLLRIFEEGVHLECYESQQELYEKLVYYKKYPDAAKKIGEEGQKLALQKFSWDEHLATTLKTLGLVNKPAKK